MKRPVFFRFSSSVLLAVAVTIFAPGAERPATLDLDTALALALENNFAIRNARSQHDEATGNVGASEARQLPAVTASAGISEVDKNLVQIPGGDTTSWQGGVQASQALYTGGAVTSAIASNRAVREATAAAYDEAIQSALLQVRIRFNAVLLSREQVGVQEQNVKLLDEELANARSRVKAGSGSPFDELRAEVALANGNQAYIRARNAYRVSAVDLLRAVGLPADEAYADSIVGELKYVPREVALESLLASARANRPDIRRFELLVTAAESGVDVARAGNRPSVAAVAGYSVQKSQYSSSNSDSVDGWNLGLQASWPIFDGHATRGKVRSARARMEQAKLALEDAALAIDADVRRTHTSYRDAIELVSATQKVIEQAEESVRLARSRFSAGAATQLDVLTAQVALTEARTNAAQALYDVSIAYAYVERAAALAPVPAAAPKLAE